MTVYNKPPVQPAWAEGGDRDDVPSAGEIQEGWPLSNTPPTRQRFNWILNWCANAIRYWMQKGIAEWDAAESYQAGGIIQAGGQTYQALRDNTNATPAGSPLDWKKWPDTSAIEASVATAVSTANAANTTAGNAVTTANAAQSTANAALPKAGGIMTGPLTLAGDASTSLQATTLQQVLSWVKFSAGRVVGFNNLRAIGGNTFANIIIGFDAAVLKDVNGNTMAVPAANLTGTLSVTPNVLGGTDGFTPTANTWQYLYAIGGPGKTTSAVFSLSDVAPNLSNAAFSGYTYYAIMAPVRIDNAGNMVPFDVCGDEILYRFALGTGTIATGGYAPLTNYTLSQIPAYVPPRAMSWKPTGFLTGSLSVNQGGSFGAMSGSLSFGRNAGDPGTVDAVVRVFDSGTYTSTQQYTIPQQIIPYVNGQTPYMNWGNSDGLNLAIFMDVKSYRYPNGAT